MAPGLVRNPKAKIIPNNSRQSLIEHMTKAGGLARSETRQYEKTDMASDKMNKGLPMTDGLSTGSETANPKFEGNMPTIQQKESTLMPEVQTPQTQQKESTMQNQSHQNGSTPDPPSHQGNQHRHISLDLMISRRENIMNNALRKVRDSWPWSWLYKGYGYGPRPPSKRKAYDLNGQGTSRGTRKVA